MAPISVVINPLFDWLSVQSHATFAILLVGFCFFAFGIARRKTPEE